jgi:colicin import membrane protein
LKTSLRAEPFRPGIALPASIGLHLFVVLSIWGASKWAPTSGPMFDPDQVMEVSLMAMPKQTTAMVQKASRAPDPVQGSPSESSPTVRTDSDLSLHEEDARPEEGNQPDAPKKSREEIMRDLKKRQAMNNANATAGSQDRLETSAEGVEGGTGSGTGCADNPELCQYLEQVRAHVNRSFKPLQSDSSLQTAMVVTVDTRGEILASKVGKSSGNASFDNAAARALRVAGALPVPPSAVMHDQDKATFTILFRAKDVL